MTNKNVPKLDLAGRRFGRLLVMKYDASSKWECACDCGTRKMVAGAALKKGETRSCGCLRRETVKLPRSHGKTGIPEYWVYRAMLNRCYDKRNKMYENYGARGISVCEQWRTPRTGFAAFFAVMGCRPSKTHSIDRVNVNGNYEPSNVRWATKREQSRNTRKTLRHEGEPLLDVAKRIGIPYPTLAGRYRRGLRGAALIAISATEQGAK